MAERRDASGNPIPMLTFEEALVVGERLHDHLDHAGGTPAARNDPCWGDLVQRVLRDAAAVLAEREE